MFKLFRAYSENKELTLKIESLESEKLKINHELGLIQNELNQTRETMGKLQIKQAEESQTQADFEARINKAREAYKALQLQLQTQQTHIDQLELQLSESKIESAQENPEQEAKIAEKDQRIAASEDELAQFALKQLKLETQNKQLVSEAEKIAQQSPPAPAATNKPRPPEDISVAVVDDSITTRTLMKKILQSARYNVSVAKDGLEGKALIEKENPDVVVTDIEMPNMDGFELTRWVKSGHAHPETPVIMITSLADEDFQARGKEAGASNFITKNNFNQQNFLAIIEKSLNN